MFSPTVYFQNYVEACLRQPYRTPSRRSEPVSGPNGEPFTVEIIDGG